MLTDDMELVREYAQSHSEQAFAALVSRHVNLVYSVALRQVRDPHLAEDVSQAVFVVLAQKAKSLSPKTILPAWLCRTARYVSADVLKARRRRQLREQESQMQSISNESDASAWEQIAPLLDEALNCLGEKEHDAIVLRFFGARELKQVGAAMGTTEDAARMRVNRGLEKLRKFFLKRGVALPAAVVAGALAAHSVQAAPAGLTASITGAALSPTTIATGLSSATQAVTMTTLQKAAIAVAFVAALGTGTYEARQAQQARAQLQSFQQQQAPLTEQVQQLQRERDATARQLAALREENSRLSPNSAELLKLRGEVAQLRKNAHDAQQLETDPVMAAAKSLVERVNILKKWLEQRPEEQIPEFQYLWDYDWIDAIKASNMLGDYAPKYAARSLRESAKRQFAHELGNALRRFVDGHNGDLPTDLGQLNAYLQRPMNEAILNRYKLLHTGKLADLPEKEWLVREIAPPFDADDWFYLLIRIGDSIQTRRGK